MHRAVLRGSVWTQGRGPELRRVHLLGASKLVALDYLNPDHSSDVRRDEIRWGPSIGEAAVVNLGKSAWLGTFSGRHLARCDHYRLMFYDEVLDLICEEISAHEGPYAAQA
jgi:hypothetical protein